jgi:hypothetical protein
MFRTLVCVFAVAVIHANAYGASADPVSEGERAFIADSSVGGGRSGATFFFLAEVDGVATAGNNMRASLQASAGRGADLRIQDFYRSVSSGKRKLKLSARFAYAAPIQSLFQKGGYGSIDGEIEVELKPSASYRVTGVLDAFRTEVWLEDKNTGELVGQKLIQALNDEATKKAMADAGYACCNLHYDGDWISDANWAKLPFIPAGSRIKLKDLSKDRANVLIEGRPMRLGLDYGREKQSMQKFADQIIVREDPKAEIATYSKAVQAAIGRGRVVIGMTKRQAIVSLGYPRLDETASLDAAKWSYWTVDEDPYALEWDDKGVLVRIAAEPAIKQLVEHAE